MSDRDAGQEVLRLEGLRKAYNVDTPTENEVLHGLDLRLQAWIKDSFIGLAVAAPVYWMFTKLLAINLPGLTNTGWL